MKRNEYITDWDTIVIGGGLSGLSSALSSLKVNPNQRICVLEKEPHVGGYVTTYKRQGHQIDTCQLIPDISRILKFFELPTKLTCFKSTIIRIFAVDPQTGAISTYEIPPSLKEFQDYLIQLSPKDSRGIELFLKHSCKIYKDLLNLRIVPNAQTILSILFTKPHILFNAHKTFFQYLKQFKISEPKIFEVLNCFVDMAGVPANQVSLFAPISIMHSLLDSACRITPHFESLPNDMAREIEALGGAVYCKAKAAKLLVSKEGCIQGCELEDGSKLLAPTVITTIDVQAAKNNLLPDGILERHGKSYAHKVAASPMSTSSFTVNIAMPEPFDPKQYSIDGGYQILSSENDAFDYLFEGFRKGEDRFSDTTFHIGISCSLNPQELAPVLTLARIPIAAQEWIAQRKKDRVEYNKQKREAALKLMSIVEKHLIPDLCAKGTILDIATPATYARYSGSPTGSIYDMMPVVSNFGAKRLAAKTPIKGLYQPKFVHGVIGALLSGMQVADMLNSGAIMKGKASL